MVHFNFLIFNFFLEINGILSVVSTGTSVEWIRRSVVDGS